MTAKNLTFILDKPLHGNVQAQEFIDAILMAGAFEQRVTVVVLGDGVFALMENQDPTVLGMKNVSTVLDTFNLYDINDVYVEEESLYERGLLAAKLQISAVVASRLQLSQQMQMAHHIFSF